MINSHGSESKYSTKLLLDGSTGIAGDQNGLSVFAETHVRYEVVGVGPLNKIDVECRIANSPNWYPIYTIVGATTGTVDISTYDHIRYNVTDADLWGGIYASGFITNLSSGSSSGGDASAANQVITNNYLASIDSKAVGNILNGIQFDEFQTTFPDSVTEIYHYYLASVLVAKVEVTYQDATKIVTTRARRL